MLEIEYNELEDTATIIFSSNGKSQKTIYRSDPLIYGDMHYTYDAENKLIRLKFLYAREHLPKELLEHAKRIQKIKSEPRDLLSPGC